MHPLTQKLNQIRQEKKSHLSVAADVTTSEELLKLTDEVGPHICLLKTHIDLITDFTPDLTKSLRALAEKHNFLIFEDRKFADIGNTVKGQYAEGIYKIAEWADIVNAHILPGEGIIQGLAEVGVPNGRGLLLLAQMSSKGNYLTPEYTKEAVSLALKYPEFVMGFIAREKLTDNPNFLHMTPGVKRASGKDALGQQYLTPENVLLERGCDIIIVGRGITQAKNPGEEAEKYRQESWNALRSRLCSSA